VKSLESELNYLLDNICRGWGFCLPRDARAEARATPEAHADRPAAADRLAQGGRACAIRALAIA